MARLWARLGGKRGLLTDGGVEGGRLRGLTAVELAEYDIHLLLSRLKEGGLFTAEELARIEKTIAVALADVILRERGQ